MKWPPLKHDDPQSSSSHGWVCDPKQIEWWLLFKISFFFKATAPLCKMYWPVTTFPLSFVAFWLKHRLRKDMECHALNVFKGGKAVEDTQKIPVNKSWWSGATGIILTNVNDWCIKAITFPHKNGELFVHSIRCLSLHKEDWVCVKIQQVANLSTRRVFKLQH